MCTIDNKFVYNIRTYDKSNARSVRPTCHLKHKNLRKKNTRGEKKERCVKMERGETFLIRMKIYLILLLVESTCLNNFPNRAMAYDF